MRHTLLTIAPILILTSFATEASAAILGTFGDVREVDAPSSVLPGDFTNNRRARIFFESVQTLESRQAVDINTPGLYTSADTFPQGFVKKGVQVASYYLMSDPGSGSHNYVGGVVFDQEILGIIVKSARLNNTQYLAAPGTLYPSTGRALDFPSDTLIFNDLHTLVIDWRTSSAQDSIRILVATPEPGTMILMGAALMVLPLVRRRLS